MLKINKQHKLPLFITLFGFASIFLFQFLTYIPEPTYAANPDNATVTVKNPKTLKLAVTENVNIETNINMIMTGEFTATVSSNAPYNIALSAADGSPTALTSSDNHTIPAVTGSQEVKAGQNGWGIKCADSADTNCEKTKYTGLTEYALPDIYFRSNSVAVDTPTKFEVGIGIDSSLPSGTYATKVLVTASQS